jgi:hypothetical protein
MHDAPKETKAAEREFGRVTSPKLCNPAAPLLSKETLDPTRPGGTDDTPCPPTEGPQKGP